jgi:hypothetical protein
MTAPRGLPKAWLALAVGAVVVTSSCAVGMVTNRCAINLLLLPDKRAFNALKNRTELPRAADFDGALTLEAMLAPGHDWGRWRPSRAGRIEGYVVRVHDAGPESANCFSLSRVDAHIEVAPRADAPPSQRVIVEVTPPMRDWAARQFRDWSTATLQRELTGRRVRVEGWLLFDDEHDEESENTRPGNDDNWRATAWEIHPVTSIAVVPQ